MLLSVSGQMVPFICATERGGASQRSSLSDGTHSVATRHMACVV